MSKNNDWFIQFKHEKNACARLFCFHYGGGSASAYKEWSKDIIDKVELVAIQLPGREARFEEPLLNDVFQVVNELYLHFDLFSNKPFVFFGHSIGALIAFEFTRCLRRYGVTKPRHLIVSGTSGPQVQLKRPLLHNLPDSMLIEEIRKFNGIPNEILEDKQLMSIFLPIIRADFSILELYEYMVEKPLNCPITALGGLNDNTFSTAQLLEWRKQTNSVFEYELLPGDHFFIRHSYPKVMQIVNKILSQELDRLNQ